MRKEEKNEFGLKKSTNRLCLVCRKYVSKKNWARHLRTMHKEVK